MPRSVVTPNEWLPRAALIVLAVTALRVALLAQGATDLFVDEAQYWLWGQTLDFGYYSKPPMIAWVIRAATELGGSDAPFWVRLPAPLFHAATALILGAIASRLWAGAAIWVSAIYVTLPMVAVGSYLISTDTIMFPFLAAGLLLWIGVPGGTRGRAFAAGVALGLAFLSKYAAIYYLPCAALAAFFPEARPTWRQALLALGAFALTIAPNVAWNIAHGLSTVEHTMDNADWVREGGGGGLLWRDLGTFFASQFAVFGPVLFAVLLWMGGRLRRAPLRIPILFALPIVAFVCVQALLGGAYANWAAAAYLAGTVAVVPWLLAAGQGWASFPPAHPIPALWWWRTGRPWLWGSLVLHGAFCLAIPLLTAFGTHLAAGPDDRLILARYLGRDEMSGAIVRAARDTGAEAIVADDRDVLADLFYSERDTGIAIYSVPPEGRAMNHYAQSFPWPGGDAPFLLVTKRDRLPEGCAAERLTRLAPARGAYRDRKQTLWLAGPECPLR
ncbi:glycosyltransferase family 39 protein [Roseicyclus sp. F158]|uniref:Glycosyltransferase family 39 protein n=1 Tax=Tropicimonas omnivorans TaxID=3075590 RepID=A0ABU3DBY7_9RHOB|nr:glycosyltransferase family 39 protein [Roseicyclus sp. F158]MDT0681226.1 glycosyltransferase family 39 protein [Roseicyclus sp. F158]